MPTTLIGLIDASVAIKVAVNHGKSKNRLGAFHASQNVILDFSFLKTLPLKEVRNGMAELIKISAVGNVGIFELLEKYGPDLLATRFGHLEGTPELRDIAHRVTYDAIATMLSLEVPNLHEDDLDRVIAFGHTWSPVLELAPRTPFYHGQAISIDMAFSTTIAEQRGYISASERDRIFWLMSRLGLTPQQSLPDPGAAADGDRLDHPDPGRAAPGGHAPADRELLLRQRPDNRGTGAGAHLAPAALPRPTRTTGSARRCSPGDGCCLPARRAAAGDAAQYPRQPARAARPAGGRSARRGPAAETGTARAQPSWRAVSTPT